MNRWFLFLALLAMVPLFAQSKWGLPDSPAGNAASKVLDAIEKGEDEFTRKFIEEFCTTSFVMAFPMKMHLNLFRDVHHTLGKFEVSSAKKTSPFEVDLILRSTVSGTKMQISVEIEREAPHRIAGIGFQPVDEKKPFSSLDELAGFLENMTEQNRFSGAVLIAKNGKPIFRRAYGLANKTFASPNTVETKFNLGSINKIFTRIAIEQLAEKGKLSFDDKVGKYLGGLNKDVLNKVTIRHLLDHRSGLGHYWNEKYRARFTELRSVADFLDLIKDESPAFEPGDREQYSNSGYVILGAIIEKVTGEDYYDYIRKNIYAVAGMNASDHYELDRVVTDLATGYTNQKPDGTRAEGFERTNVYLAIKGSPAGGGYSTIDDMLKFDSALKEGKFFSTGAATESFRRMGGVGIAGGSPGCNAILESNWPSGNTVVVLSNYDPPTAEQLGLDIMEMLKAE